MMNIAYDGQAAQFDCIYMDTIHEAIAVAFEAVRQWVQYEYIPNSFTAKLPILMNMYTMLGVG